MSRPGGATLVTDLENFSGFFIRLTISHYSFKFHVIRFTGYGVIAEKTRVSQFGRIFSVHIVGKTMHWIIHSHGSATVL